MIGKQSPSSCGSNADHRLRLAVVHWLPLEQFPPACNLLSFLSRDPRLEVFCGTSVLEDQSRVFACDKVEIFRGSFPSVVYSRLIRAGRFVALCWILLRTLWKSRPHAVLYFEPHSAPVVFLYLVFHRSVRLFIHYHEYREICHYRDRGNAIARLGHWLECWFLFHRCEWISHTNSDRVRMFLEDHPQVAPWLLHAVPNYPPPEWLSVPVSTPENANVGTSGTLRLVYVGAMSLQTTFIREVVDWVTRIGGNRVRLDVYAGSMDKATVEYLGSLNSDSVRFMPSGVPYEQLPVILRNYDVGLILYRGTTRNYIYNAPNKLFEYLTCGLDVWYPRQMLGIRPVAAGLHNEQVLEVDFEQPATLDQLLQEPRKRNVGKWRHTSHDALAPLHCALLEKNTCG